MITHSALPLFIQHDSPGETDSFILDCADDCGFTDMSEVEGRGDEDYDTSRPAILEFATRLLRRQRLLERLIVLLSADEDRVIYLKDNEKFWRLPYELVGVYLNEVTTLRLGLFEIVTVDKLYDAMEIAKASRDGAARLDRTTKLSWCIQFLLDDIVQYDLDFQDMRDADAARDERNRERTARAWAAHVVLHTTFAPPPPGMTLHHWTALIGLWGDPRTPWSKEDAELYSAGLTHQDLRQLEADGFLQRLATNALFCGGYGLTLKGSTAIRGTGS